ncbi:MAG: hypothetical protein Q9M40_08450, partial [Sulfurimonas sp.]|nr:hypothetical protein [Sulfurimonas sp.]
MGSSVETTLTSTTTPSPPYQIDYTNLPECTNSWDEITNAANDALNYTADIGENTVAGTFDLVVHGDPDRLIEAATDYQLLHTRLLYSITNYAMETMLPNGGVKDMMIKVVSTSVKIQETITQSVVSGSVYGIPDAVSSIESGFLEITADAWNVLSNIDDPEAFAKNLLLINQKWTPYMTWTVMLTSGNPLEGMKK